MDLYLDASDSSRDTGVRPRTRDADAWLSGCRPARLQAPGCVMMQRVHSGLTCKLTDLLKHNDVGRRGKQKLGQTKVYNKRTGRGSSWVLEY